MRFKVQAGFVQIRQLAYLEAVPEGAVRVDSRQPSASLKFGALAVWKAMSFFTRRISEMKTSQRTVLGTVSAMLLLGLAGCAAPEGSAAPKNKEPQKAETEAPVAKERKAPQSCTALDLTPGAEIDGAALGVCVSEALSSYGSGKMQLTADTYGDIEFTYDPKYSFQGEMQGSDGPFKMTFLDDVMWIDRGSGPVKGDLKSDDPEEKLVGVTGELYRIYSDLDQTAQMVKSQPVWKVDEAMDKVSLPNGESVESYKIVSDGPFSWNEIPVSEFILWFGKDWVPVGDQASVEFMGTKGTHTQKFYDLGEPVTIKPLS
ncbi:hypothetical protein [Streptomyces sp. NPDC052042]|uniref:hypothetical protein n=1 Tax=Streptomyces sp. NPDC052042 TaxID=3365683 RepID=UPI0037D629D0